VTPIGAIEAPWTDDQVASLNAYQACGYRHPFTYGDGPAKSDMIATRDGWVVIEGGQVVQNWAWAWMADWTWKLQVKEGEA
jgi:hypothetical protein